MDAVGKRVLNFQISYSLYGFAAITLFGLLWWLVIGFIFLAPLRDCGSRLAGVDHYRRGQGKQRRDLRVSLCNQVLTVSGHL